MNDQPIVFGIPRYEAYQRDLCAQLHGQLGAVERKQFPDGERYQRLETDVEGRDVVVVGGTIDDEATLCLYDLASTTVTYGARRLSLVVPYYGYSTMERATQPGEAIVAKTRARLFSAIPRAASGNRVFLLDLHSEGIPHYFEGGCTAFHIYAKPLIAPVIRALGGDDYVLGSTDSGRAKWVESLANDLGVEAAFILKRRLSGSETRVTALNASVSNRLVIIYDDMIRSGGSLIGAAQAYRDAGAAGLIAVCTHGVFVDGAYERLSNSGLFDEIVATDSHPTAPRLVDVGLRIVPTAASFVEHLRR
ncbi:MAG: ribose-phosphate diphosphokinase [Myxococcota bacterium]|nr:ribose-phosphate diphosphokinase [Myxococcota bacterium]